MTSAAGATTPGATRRAPATVHITDAGCRLHVRVTHPDRAIQDDARSSFRAAFPRHGQRVWLAGDPTAKEPRGCWSIPRAAWRVLEAWAVGQGYRVAWVDPDDGGSADGAGGEGNDDGQKTSENFR